MRRKSREVAGWPTEWVRQPISSTRVRDAQWVVRNRGPPRELVGDVQGEVERNPPEGRHRAARLYRTRPVTPTTSAPLYDNASGLQLTPSTGHRFSLGLHARSSIWEKWRSLHREYVVTPTYNRPIEAFDSPSMTNIESASADWAT